MRIVLAVLFALALGACAKSPPTVADAPPAQADAAAPAEPPEVLPPPDIADDTTEGEATGEDAGAIDEGTDEAGEAPAESIAVGEPNPGAPGIVDQSCDTDADCAIKDVGSCCGYRPACVNADSPTFPKQVQAECAKDGRMGICGFPAITGCKCTAGQCEGTGAGAAEIIH